MGDWIDWNGPGVCPLPSGGLVDLEYHDGELEFEREVDDVASLFGVYDDRVILHYADMPDGVRRYRAVEPGEPKT